MIRFACTCSKVLQIPEDRAGSSIQCPFCGLLVDVPLLSDLASMSEDGTYKMEPAHIREEVNRLAELQRAFAKQRVDDLGREIDLRPNEDDFANVGDPEVLEFADDPAGKPLPPKYDPITGELVREIGIKDDRPRVNPDNIPIANAVINYARAGTDQAFPASRIIPEMFKFTNMTVMLAVFLFHLLIQMMTIPIMAGLFLLVPAFIGTWALLQAHYAVIIEDIGVEQNDELPRPLRDLSWTEDLWGPFTQFAGALFLCYGATIARAWMPPIAANALVIAVLLAGTIAFPAVLLTLTTSGSVVNLSPDRLLRVMRELGGSYVLCVVLWVIGGASYVLGIVASLLSLLTLFVAKSTMPWAPPLQLGYPLLLAGIFLMHGFCWYLGLQYRQHHESFGWAFQRHIRTKPPVQTATPAARTPANRARSNTLPRR
jgi:hypothetical protein